MKRASQCAGPLALCCLFLPGALFAQATQVLQDAWAATSAEIFDLEDLATSKNPGEATTPNFQAIAFEELSLAGQTAARNLIAVSGTRILRYINGTTVNSAPPPAYNDPTEVLDTQEAPIGFRFVTSIAVASDGNILFSGYSRRKRRFELWEYDEKTDTVTERTDGNPQLTDTVYISAEDAAGAGAPFTGGGLLGAAGREVLFFPAGDYDNYQTVVDVRNLPAKNNTKILSADLIRGTPYLTLALSTREVMTVNIGTGALLDSSSIPRSLVDDRCASGRAQLLLIRNRGTTEDATLEISGQAPVTGSFGVNVISDACGQVLEQYFQYAASTASYFPFMQATDESLVALAVGEGNQVTCFASQPECTITSGYIAAIDFEQGDEQSELLVLKVEGLCDPRIDPTLNHDPDIDPPATSCFNHNFHDDTLADYDSHYTSVYGDYGIYSNTGVLVLNDQLPSNLQDALALDGVFITIPNYMFSAAPDAEFGAVFVEADEFSRDALIDAWLDIDTLLRFDGLGVRTLNPVNPAINPPLIAGVSTAFDVLNSDVVAYAPDNPLYPTVRGFEATPVTIGEGSVYIRKRGYSVDIFGLMHDVSGPSGRRQPEGGISATLLNENGILPTCPLAIGNEAYIPVDSSNPLYLDAYFLNLVACLFGDVETLLTSDIIPDEDPDDGDDRTAALSDADRQALSDRLDLLKDKLIKALNAAIPTPGPNAGATTFQSTITQLNQFDSLLESTPFSDEWKIYKNDLTVRSEVLRFNLLERANVLIEP